MGSAAYRPFVRNQRRAICGLDNVDRSTPRQQSNRTPTAQRTIEAVGSLWAKSRSVGGLKHDHSHGERVWTLRPQMPL